MTGRGCSVGKDLSAARTFELRPQGDEELEEGHPRQRGVQRHRGRKALACSGTERWWPESGEKNDLG